MSHILCITHCHFFQQNVNEAVIFEPALFPILPGDQSVMATYRVPTVAKSHLKEESQITVVVDTPYNTKTVRCVLL